MLKLEDLVAGARVEGLEPRGAVIIMALKSHGDGVVEAIWKNDQGALSSSLLYRDNEADLSLAARSRPWSFDADGDELCLASEAWRIHYAHLFDPYLAIHISDVDPLPHQISAVYKDMLERLPLRFLLADDPGAGKTIMTGLLIRELIARGDLQRCLIVCPGSLAEQWQDELYRKFHLHFDLMTNDRIKAAVTGNAFEEAGFAIARMDKLARNDDLLAKLSVVEWDLVVCDEAHKMSASLYGSEISATRRFNLGKLLSEKTRNFLLLTATPHNGKEDDFQIFLSLIDEDRFGPFRKGGQPLDVSDVMRRLVKEDLLKFDGSPLFPERVAVTLNYDLSPDEMRLYEAVTAYVQTQFDRADRLSDKRRITVGFALTVLQRRLASSPEAIYKSLCRRREKLEKRLAEELSGQTSDKHAPDLQEDFDEDECSAMELEALEDEITDKSSASTSIAELEAELATLRELELMASQIRASGRDRKWEELSSLLQENRNLYGRDGAREKLIIFTEHRDTLQYLAARIRSLLGSQEAVATIDGSLGRDDRRRVEDAFKQDKETLVLVATDAAGEGINLQRSHFMVNYDLPWNPNRLEQRFGRIHRIGQNRICRLWNLVASQTREGAVFKRLFDKLEQERSSLGGKVFDVLGKVSFNNKPLKDLLIEAVRHDESHSQFSIKKVIDSALDRDALIELMREHALVNDTMDPALVTALREQMERLEARRLQPHYIQRFFRKAFSRLGGRLSQRESGRYEITYVPAILRNRRGIAPVLTRYERVCFDKAGKQGSVPAELLCPGHPLLDAVLDVMLEKSGELMRRGAILINENDYGEACHALFYIESAIVDGIIHANGKRRVISRQIQFVNLWQNGDASPGGPAPYLDCRAASEEESRAIRAYLAKTGWPSGDMEEQATRYAATHIVPQHMCEVRERKLAHIEKTEKEVRRRLTSEIQYWDERASELVQNEKAGKRNAALNSAQARARAEKITQNLSKRLEELAREKHVAPLPTHVAGGALVVPLGLLYKLLPEAAPVNFSVDAQARKRIEERAMYEVMEIERKLGFFPEDVSDQKVGYDICSHIPEHMREKRGSTQRFIEVKGRARGAETVTLTCNEITTALNTAERFILAIVEVDGESASTVYLKRPFQHPPQESEACAVLNIEALKRNSEIIYSQS